jgi:hypothetical protein
MDLWILELFSNGKSGGPDARCVDRPTRLGSMVAVDGGKPDETVPEGCSSSMSGSGEVVRW